MREFEGPVHPAAATPAGRPHIPIRVIIERDEHERLGYRANPKSREMVEIAGAEENKRRQVLARFPIKFLDQARGRGEAKLRPP